MSKDPAVLFYTQDFITGTMFFTFEQKGKYISLLCAQHQHGGLINKNDFNALVGDDTALRNKFIETDDGFYNERLMKEMEKRSVKSSNLSAVAKIRWDKEKQKQCKSNAKAMRRNMPTEDENEDENEDINVIKNRGNGKGDEIILTNEEPTLKEVIFYFTESGHPKELGESFYSYYAGQDWRTTGGMSIKKNWQKKVIGFLNNQKQYGAKDGVSKRRSSKNYVDPEEAARNLASAYHKS